MSTREHERTWFSAPTLDAIGVCEVGPLPLTLHASRVKGSLCCCWCVLVLHRAWAYGWESRDTHEWIGLDSAPCCLEQAASSSTINLLPNASFLRLEEDGFTYSSLFRQPLGERGRQHSSSA